MPLHYERCPLADVHVAVWKITEEDAYFLKRLPSDDLTTFLPTLKGRRKTEWLASRWLCYLIAQNDGPIVKDSHGKPGFSGQMGKHLSLSHTHGYTAVITAPFLVGIDIQTRVEKIQRLAKKFLNEQELSQLTPGEAIDQLHIYWGAKESVYKAYGERQLDFRAHIRIHPFHLDGGTVTGSINKEVSRNYQIYFERWEEFVLVYALDRDQVF